MPPPAASTWPTSNALPGAPHPYAAKTTGEFNQAAQPTEETLMLKPGAKVMLLRNDPDTPLGQRHHRARRPPRGEARVGGGRRRGARGRAGVLGEPPLRLRQGRRENCRDRGRHVHAVPAPPRLGAHHPQEPGPDARQGVHRPRARHLRPRPGLRCAVALPDARRAWRWRDRFGPPTSCSTAPPWTTGARSRRSAEARRPPASSEKRESAARREPL